MNPAQPYSKLPFFHLGVVGWHVARDAHAEARGALFPECGVEFINPFSMFSR